MLMQVNIADREMQTKTGKQRQTQINTDKHKQIETKTGKHRQTQANRDKNSHT